ncbi:hypothetical protein DL96DRAFT_1812490 [Flagelloscypha sp. PMI_526]|nr:hypothetical protein DL96DRAFT_1812490 [Flagelloscypha sp. PMI_526]
MMATLPPELWHQIIFLLPRRSRESFKMVCRAFQSLVLTSQLITLDLVLESTKAERLQEELKRRIGLASQNPVLFRVLRVSTTSQIHSQPIMKRDRGLPRFKHLLKYSRSAPTPAVSSFDLAGQLILLIPHLTQVHELQIVDQHQPISCPNQSLRLAWKAFSSTLTTLVVRLSTRITNIQCFHEMEEGKPALPALQTLKLQYCTSTVFEDPDLWRTIQSLTSHSPLLEEVQHEFGRDVPRHGSAIWIPTDPSIHPKFRAFKWVSLRTDSRGPSLTSIDTTWSGFQTLLRAFASQLRVLHIDAFRSQHLWEGIELSSLTELRLDLHYGNAREDTLTFFKIGQMSALAVLEICGRSPDQDGLHRLLPMMPSLQELYFPVHFRNFSRRVLNEIAGKTPNLRKLVLRYENGTSMASIEPYVLGGMVQSFRETSAPDYLSGWPLRDVGILNPSRITPTEYRMLLQCVADAAPSIKLLYGSTDWTILKGDKFDIGWDGQLTWMKKHWPI